MQNLGILYDAGRGVEKNHARANALYREAIEADSTDDIALWNLGLSHFEGTAVTPSLPAALSLWRRAADLGNAQAQRNIATAYLQGDGGYEQTGADKSYTVQLNRKLFWGE
jgi:hypothetical protein